ncbi:MAG: alcohol dehydrogenase catalytic domain-containing protein [Verrucomicrobia bacterium]|nr:alcohol dehydrogenase catalytic domain-containing protein [Verrucomicrobiota bacterium]
MGNAFGALEALGHEPVGEIVALGPGVTARQKGDRVGVPCIQQSRGGNSRGKHGHRAGESCLLRHLLGERDR